MAKFFVNRGGGRAPEGPFEEQQIVKLILAGKLRSGYASEVGTQRFFPLEKHPLFARALSEAGVAPAPAPLQVKRAKPSANGSSRRLLLAAVLCFFGLALAAVSIGTYVMFSNGGMPARGAVPEDAELFFEVTSVPQTLAHLHDVRVLDIEKLDGKRLLTDAAADLSASFGVSQARADALILAASSLGIAGRKLGSAPEGGLLLTFNSSTAMNAFLSSKRFRYVALVAKNGRRYELSKEAAEPGANVSATRRSLAALSLGSPGVGLFWFETTKVLFIGSPSFAESVARVLSLDLPSLEKSPNFQAILRGFSGKPDAIGYLDAAKLTQASDPRVTAVLSYVQGTGPIAASLQLVPAGVMARFGGHIAASSVAKPALAGSPALALSLSDRFPSETFAYAAAATKTPLSGTELERLMLQQVASADPARAEDVRTGVALIEQRLHVHFDQLLGSLGDQGAVGLVAPADYGLALASPPQMLANFALIAAQQLKDEAPLRALFKEWQAALGPLATEIQIQEQPDGYTLTPKLDALGVSAQIHFSKGELFIVLGNNALVERSWRAFSSGERTLGSDAAHRAARASLPGTAQIFAWVDAGRVIATVEKNPFLASRVSGLSSGALRLSGPNRATAAFALSGTADSGGYSYSVDTLNLPAFYGLFGLSLP